jgi:protein TonB
MSAVMSGPDRRGGAGNRALAYAVLVSFVFHAGLLFLVSLERQARRESPGPGPIVARLVAPQPAVLPPRAPAQPEPPKPHAPEPKPPPPKPEAKPKPVVKPVPLPKPSPVPAPRTREPIAQPEPAAPPQPAPPPVAPAPSSSAAVPPAPPAAQTDQAATSAPAPSPDQGTLEAYRIDLMRMARNYKRYPRVAMDNNWEGRAVVRLVIGANGMTKSLLVVSGTGHEVLDKQALDMIQKAKPRVQIPSALRGREFTIEIPVIYDLKDQPSG